MKKFFPFLTCLLGLLMVPFLTLEVSADPNQQGAWPIKHKWEDRANDSGQTFVELYHEYAAKRAKEMYEKKIKLDCADMAITILVEFAHKHKLEVSFWFPVEKKTVSCTDKRFQDAGFKGFVRWARNWVGAQNLADNTYAVSVGASKAGDVVLFDWGQSPESPNFPGRVVWHTYFVASDGAKDIYYGNMASDGTPYAITVAGSRVQDRIHNHPDRYGKGARRWKLFEKAPPSPPSEEAIEKMDRKGKVTASLLNARRGPSTHFDKIDQLKEGTPVKVIGKVGKWYQVDLGNGKKAWLHEGYVKLKKKEAAANPSENNSGNGNDGALDRLHDMDGNNNNNRNNSNEDENNRRNNSREENRNTSENNNE